MKQSLADIVGQVKDRATAMEHDLQFWSCFMGEPVLFDKWLGYYDGRKLLLYGGALDDGAAISGSFLKEIVQEYEKSAAYVECWLPGPPPDIQCDGWQMKRHRENSVALHIDVSSLNGEIPFRAKELLLADKKGIVVSRLSDGYLSMGHIDLIRKFMQFKKLQAFDFAYYAYVSYFLSSRSGFAVQAVIGDKICALATMSTFLPHRLVYTHLFLDKNVKGISDVMYRFAIRYCIEHGIATLDLGYSFSEGAIAYKKKWGAVESNRPIESIAFVRPSAQIGPFHCWPFEMLFNP